MCGVYATKYFYKLQRVYKNQLDSLELRFGASPPEPILTRGAGSSEASGLRFGFLW